MEQSAIVVIKNNSKSLRKSSHKGHKFLNSKKFKFSNKKNNSNFSVADNEDTHTKRAKKEAILITIFGIIPVVLFCLYLFGVI